MTRPVMVTAAALATLAVVAAVSAAQPTAPAPPAFVVIVHPENESDSLRRDFVADAFLKRVTRWPSGERLEPVEVSGAPAVKRQFAQSVLRRTVEALRSHWQQVIFSGRGLPPRAVRSEDEVVSFVLRTRGAIGYVSGTARLRGARTVRLR